MNRLDALFYAAAATTAIAGIIHVVLGYDSGRINAQILFLWGVLPRSSGSFQW